MSRLPKILPQVRLDNHGRKMALAQCAACNGPFYRRPSDLQRAKHPTCSRRCGARLRWMRKRFASSAPRGQAGEIGRKEGGLLAFSVSLTLDQRRVLEQLGDGNLSLGARRAVEIARRVLARAKCRSDNQPHEDAA